MPPRTRCSMPMIPFWAHKLQKSQVWRGRIGKCSKPLSLRDENCLVEFFLQPGAVVFATFVLILILGSLWFNELLECHHRQHDPLYPGSWLSRQLVPDIQDVDKINSRRLKFVLFHSPGREMSRKSANHSKILQQYSFETLNHNFGMLLTNFKNAVTIFKMPATVSREVCHHDIKDRHYLR